MSNTQTAAKWEMRDGVLCYAGKATLIQTIFGLDATLDLAAKLNSHAALAAENARLREALKALYDNVTAISNIGFDDDTLDAFEQARVALEGGAN